MAVLISRASGSFSDAATWGVVDNNSILDSEEANSTTTLGYIYAPLFTPGAITVDGIAIKIYSRNNNGTVTVQLYNNTDSAIVEEVTISVTEIPVYLDVPYNHGWYFFKFPVEHTLIAGKAYKVGIKTSINGSLSFYRAGVTNFSKMIRTTGSAAPGASDVLHIMGDHGTTSGTYSVLMDNTAITQFGTIGSMTQAITVNSRGTLTWDTAEATSYYFRWRGPFVVFEDGTLNVGTSGSAIPSTSTAVMEMHNAAVRDTYLSVNEGAVCSMYGANVSTPYTKLITSVGGVCNTAFTVVTALAGSQLFTGLTGAIVVDGVSYTIASVTSGSVLRTTATTGTKTGVSWYHPGTSGTVFVDATTGWAVSDQIAFASTTNLTSDFSKGTIASISSGTQVILNATLAKAHFGAEPMQAEVGHLTRNVKVRSFSPTLTGYVRSYATSKFTVSGVEFSKLGSRSTGAFGVSADTIEGIFDMQYCSLYDFTVSGSMGINQTSVVARNVTVKYCVVYNVNTELYYSAANTYPTTVLGNLFMYVVANNVDASCDLATCYGIFQDNTVVGASAGGNAGIYLRDATNVGTFKGNTVHSTGGLYGLYLDTGDADSLIEDQTCWACLYGIVTANDIHLKIRNLTTFACTAGVFINSYFVDLSINGWTNYGIRTLQGNVLCQTALLVNIARFQTIQLQNVTLGVVSGIKVGPTEPCIELPQDNNIYPSAVAVSNGTFTGSPIGDTGAAKGLAGVASLSSVSIQKYNGTVGNNQYWTRSGTITSDYTAYTSGTVPSIRMTPNTGGVLDCRCLNVAIANGNSATVSVDTRQSVASDGFAYSGSRPAFWVKQCVSAGIATDTLLATATVAGSGTYETLSGVIGPVTDNSIVECFVRCGGTNYTGFGWVNVDNAVVDPSSVNTGGLSYWKAGQVFYTNGASGPAPVGGGAWAATYTY